MGRLTLAAALAAVVFAGCGDEPAKTPAPRAPDKIKLTSTAFRDGGTIPKAYTCDGKGDPPPLRGVGVPKAAKSLALLVEDPDAPSGAFVHWTAWDLKPRAGAVSGSPTEGRNSAGKSGWTPPCPPGGKPHRYVFTLYALSKPLGIESGAPPDAVHHALGSRAIARGRLVGRFGR